MKWRIYTVGKPALGYARNGAEEYLKRLRRYTNCQHLILRKGDAAEIQGLLGSRRDGHLNLVLDERGETLTTQQFTHRLQTWQLDAVKTVSCFIGGADGHHDTVRQEADVVLRLSALTMQHELALVVLLEQIYRAYTILKGEPYHR